MTNTFYLASAPEYFGSDVTPEQAEIIAIHLAQKIEGRFDVEVELTKHSIGYYRNDESDADGRIQQWVNDNWADEASEALNN